MNETRISVFQNEELKESFKMIPNSNQFPGISTLKIHFLNFCVGVYVGEHPPTNFLYGSKDAQENSTSFDTDVVTGSISGNEDEKRPTQKSYTDFFIPEFNLKMTNLHIKNYLPKIFRVAKAPNSDCNMCCRFLN